MHRLLYPKVPGSYILHAQTPKHYMPRLLQAQAPISVIPRLLHPTCPGSYIHPSTNLGVTVRKGGALRIAAAMPAHTGYIETLNIVQYNNYLGSKLRAAYIRGLQRGAVITGRICYQQASQSGSCHVFACKAHGLGGTRLLHS